MTAALLLFYTFAAFGFCYVVGAAVISRPLREWIAAWYRPHKYICGECRSAMEVNTIHHGWPPGDCGMCGKRDWTADGRQHGVFEGALNFVECPACLGFWVGLASGFVVGRLEFHFGSAALVGFAVLVGCYTAGVNFVLGRITGLIAQP